MRKLLMVLAGLFVMSSAYGANAPKELAGVTRLVIMGDSITQIGDGPTGYVGLIRERLKEYGIEVVNAGISGNKSTDMLDRFQRDVLDKKPQMVTISVGVNDVWHGFYDNHPEGDGPRGVAQPVYREKITAMITAAKQAGVKVVLVSPTVIHEDLTNKENAKLLGYVAAMRDMAKTNGCQFVDLNSPFREIIAAYQKRAGKGTLLLTVDGVHMVNSGNRLMATGILRALGVDR